MVFFVFLSDFIEGSYALLEKKKIRLDIGDIAESSISEILKPIKGFKV